MEVMEKGRVTHSPLFIIRAIVTGEDVHIAAVAPKKVAPTAVLRNSIKRHIYEAVQPLIASVTTSAGQGIHIIIFAKTEAVKADFKAIGADIKNLFMKAKISV